MPSRFSYMGHAKFSLLAVGVLASVAAIASLAGTYMVRPIVNGLATGGEELLAKQVILTAIIYAAGVLSALGYSQIMVRAAQRVVSDIRRDLFAHIQTLPLSYFDSTRSGDIMSFFTNDVDTVSEALNNSFANVIQAAIQVVGTTAMLIILNWQLTIITLVCDAAIVLYARYSGARSKRFFAAQQASLGDLDGYIEEMVSGQKVIKVFNREAVNVTGFTCRNDELRRTGTAAVSYANSMVPMTVVIGYVNYAIVAVAGGMLCIKGLADVGALASYLVFVRQAAMPINQFTQLGNFLLNALAGAERLFAAMDLKPEVDEGCVELVQTGDAAWAWKIPEGQGVGAYGHLHDVAAVDESGRAVAADGTELTCGLVSLAGDVRFHAVDFSYVPGARVLINDLKAAGVRVWGLSNWQKDLFPVALDHYDILCSLEDRVVSGYVGLRKPHRDIYDYALKQFGIDASGALFVDDKAMNIVGANEAGIRGVRFKDARALRTLLIDAGVAIPAVHEK